GDPPPCFHFAAAVCTLDRYNNPRNGYEQIGANMKWSEADKLVEDQSRYFNDSLGCNVTATRPTPPTPPGTPEKPPTDPPADTPKPPAQAETPPAPTRPVLSRFGVFCTPSTIKVGESASCRAVGEYTDKPGVYVDLSGSVSWDGGPAVTGVQEGPVSVSASLDGAS